LKIIQEQDVDATLGSDSIQKSLIAGAIGAAMIIIFMLLYYRLSGLVACMALIIYTVVLLAIFKLVPITLTLPGVAAFIVSLGMAVDANVLIFERMKEELRAGRTIGAAVEAGFSRAWPAIRDSNVTTFIACIILAWFGTTMGAFMVSGFAITLFIGVALSMFSAITISRMFLLLMVQMVKSPSAYGVWK
jgi:preprotein translocase subunit SecD